MNKTLLADILAYLENMVDEKKASSDLSYTSKLLSDGIPRLSQKVGEEAIEVVIAAMGKDKKLVAEETADLLYHLFVLLGACEVSNDDVARVLLERKKK